MHVDKGPVEIMQTKINDYGLAHKLSNALNMEIIVKTDQWKQKVDQGIQTAGSIHVINLLTLGLFTVNAMLIY